MAAQALKYVLRQWSQRPIDCENKIMEYHLLLLFHHLHLGYWVLLEKNIQIGCFHLACFFYYIFLPCVSLNLTALIKFKPIPGLLTDSWWSSLQKKIKDLEAWKNCLSSSPYSLKKLISALCTWNCFSYPRLILPLALSVSFPSFYPYNF